MSIINFFFVAVVVVVVAVVNVDSKPNQYPPTRQQCVRPMHIFEIVVTNFQYTLDQSITICCALISHCVAYSSDGALQRDEAFLCCFFFFFNLLLGKYSTEPH